MPERAWGFNSPLAHSSLRDTKRRFMGLRLMWFWGSGSAVAPGRSRFAAVSRHLLLPFTDYFRANVAVYVVAVIRVVTVCV